MIYRMVAVPPEGARKIVYKCRNCGAVVDITAPGVEVTIIPPSRSGKVICGPCRKPAVPPGKLPR